MASLYEPCDDIGRFCEWTRVRLDDVIPWPVTHCDTGQRAIHVLRVTMPQGRAGTALCAHHSPFGS